MIRKCIPCGGEGIISAASGGWKLLPGEWIDDTRDGQYCLCYPCEGEGLVCDIESESPDQISIMDLSRAELECYARPAFGTEGWFEITAKDYRGR